MSPTKKLLLAVLCFSCIQALCITSYAQVVAGISANGRAMIHGDTINVCRGSEIIYESLAQGSSVVNWKFNNGTPGTMTGTGPFSVTYNTNGYDTTFQKAGSGAFSDSMFIIVRVADEKPFAGYNFLPDNVCGNDNIQFTNTSVNGEPFRFHWDFGDGATSTEESPSHQYLNAVGSGTQTFPVKMIVINANTCVDSITRTVTIRSVPDAAIGNADPGVTVDVYKDTISFRTCNNEPFYNFKFTNESSTIAANASYSITWGDGSPDSVFTSWPAGDIINHNFPSGSSSMTLNVTGTSGCVGIKNYIVYVGVSPFGTMTTPGSTEICETDSLSFVLGNTAGNSPGTSYIFYINDFSEGQFFQHPNPGIIGHRFTKNSCSFLSDNGSQVFSNALGAYLLIQNPCGVNSAAVVPIHVSGKPKPSIFVSEPSTCVNTTVSLINTSGFGNVITPTGGVTATCESKGKNVWSISPTTGFTIVSGNLGSLNGNLTDQAFWTDGTDSLDIQFTDPGVYTAKIYIGNERCGMDSTITTICVRSAPQASFTMSQRNSCGPVTVDLTNTSPVNECNPADDEYLWTITYSDPEGCAVAGEPTYAFANGTTETSKSPSLSFTAAGRYIIQLLVIATNAGTGCAEGTITDTFYVKGPVKAEVAALPAACVNNSITPTMSFTSCYSTGPFGYQWLFTNGSPASSTDSLPGLVSFNLPGDQPVQLIVTDSSCMQSGTVNTIITINPLPATTIINDTTICNGETISLGGAAVAGVVYQWSPSAGLNDPSVSNPSATLNYNGPAIDTVYTYFLDISQGIYCNKTDSVKIIVGKTPVVAVTPVSVQFCMGDSSVLTASGADTYTWEPAASLNNPTAATVIAKPAATTIYTVSGFLANGCSALQNVTVAVYEAAVADFNVTPVSLCTGQAVTVTNNSANATGFEWAWGDGSNSNFSSGQHSYNDAGVYDITLVAERADVSGFVCRDTSSKQVEVINKIGAQVNVGPESKCVPYTLNVDAGTATGASLIEWVIYDSSAAPGEFYTTGQSASHTYTKAGSYAVRLVVHSATGCTDTAFYQFNVFGTPITAFEPRLITVCNSDTTVNFVAQTQGSGEIINYKWFVNENLLGTTNPFTHHFQGTAGSTVPEEFTIRLEAQNGNGCGETSLTGIVTLNSIPDPLIQVSPALVQQQPNYEFTFKEINTSNPNMIYTWTMGDRFMQTQTGQQITYLYGDTGTYTVRLVVTDFATGCKASDSVKVTILYLAGYIQVPNAICPGCSNFGVRKFLPLAKGLKKYRLRIYTTWGQKIFETSSIDANGSPNVPWDGTLNGKPLQQDVYSWQIEGTFQNGTEWKGMIYPGSNRPVKAGFITVIK
ncbi:MAG: PKD domain-containing protein [Chitinophagaceae bacterium]